MDDHFLIYLIVFSVLGLFFAYFVYLFYDLKDKAERVLSAKEKLEDTLDARFKNFEHIISLIKHHLDFEHTVLKEIIQLRSYAQTLKENHDTKAQFETEEKISKIGDVVFEAYPEIKQLKNFEELKKENITLVHAIEMLKIEYNNSVELYNRQRYTSTGSFISKIFKRHTYYIFDYWPMPKHRNYYQTNKLKI